MSCITPSSRADASWGELYIGNAQRTANTAVMPDRTRPETAARVYALNVEPIDNTSVWDQPLRDLRANLHATVHQLASALGVKRQSVHAWQRGEKQPSSGSKLRIAQLQAAAIKLNASIGTRLPLYLNRPLGQGSETFWNLLAQNMPAEAAADLLIKTAQQSTSQRFTLRKALLGKLPTEPLDRNG